MEKYEDLLEKLIFYINEGMSISQIHRLLNVKKNKFNSLLNNLRRHYNVVIKDDYIFISRLKNFDFYHIDDTLSKIMFISDTHMFSKYERLDILDKAYDEVIAKDIKYVIHLGDLVDGYYKGIYEQVGSLYSSDPNEQCEYVIDKYPFVNGVSTYLVTGNHDFSLKRHFGIDVGEVVSESRSDFVYLGYSVASVCFENYKMLLTHGNDNLKCFSDFSFDTISHEVNGRYDLIARGHSHGYGHYFVNNTNCLQVPCMLGNHEVFCQNSFDPTIGYVILEIEGNELNILPRLVRKQ